AACGRDLQEVRAVALVKPQGRLREGRRGAIHVGEVAPERIRRSVGRLAPEHGLNPFELGHASLSVGGFESAMPRAPSITAAWPSGVSAGTAMTRSWSEGAAFHPMTVIAEGSRTMPPKRQPIRVIGAPAPRPSRSTILDTASASVAVPCRMMSGNPAFLAAALSV